MYRVKAGWRCFSRSFNRETRDAFRKPVIHWLGWIFPLLLFILISSNFSEGTLLDLPVSVVDNDHSTLSKTLIRKLDAGSHAHVQAFDGGLQEAEHRLRTAQDYALLSVRRAGMQTAQRGALLQRAVLRCRALFHPGL